MSLIKLAVLNLFIMYPFLELTRLIVWYAKTYSFDSRFVIELGTFWVCWIIFNIFLTKTVSPFPKKM